MRSRPIPPAGRFAAALAAASLVFAAPPSAQAHVGHGTMGSGGFLDGFGHPVTGLDHLVAMVAVGLWGAQLGPPAIWVLPVAFPLVMAVGAFLGLLGVYLPGVSLGVALSGAVLGAMIALAARPPLVVAGLVVVAFAVVHGHAHGAAMPMSGSPLAFGAGFVLATGLLHLSGVVFGLLIRWKHGAALIRLGGVVIALTALAHLPRSLGLVSE